MLNFRVLIVDDEADFLETIVKRLRKRGLEAEGVPSGEAAIETMKEKRFDVVLLDIKMPRGIDGIETFRELKKLQPLAEVIFLTGHATLESSVEGMKLGAFDYLIKPVKLDELLPKLAEAFQKKNSHEQKIRNYKIQELIRHPASIFEMEKDDFFPEE
jgi:two-component system OmpR family response regulator